VKENKLSFDEFMASSTIKERMIKDRYSFINFDKKKQDQLFNELIIANNKEIHESSYHLKKELCIHEEEDLSALCHLHEEAEKELIKLKKLLKQNNIDF
jgi:hypothetical protein